MPLFAISHAHANRKDPTDALLLKKFVTDLKASVFRASGVSDDESLVFIDYDGIQTGDTWNATLATAFHEASVGVALYSPHYFNSEWCGREYQLFLDRSPDDQVHSGIIPVLWVPAKNISEKAKAVQYADGGFPDAYREVGLFQLAKLASYHDEYLLSVDRIAELILTASNPGLRNIPEAAFSRIESAWKPGVAPSNSAKPMSGSVTKACFVYLSARDWQWKPYSNGMGINAMALKIASDMDVEFERIACDQDLIGALEKTARANIPTILLGDPEAINDATIANALTEYDQRTLANCGALFAWPAEAQQQLDGRPEWNTLYQLCNSKITDAKPYHEWRTIFSQQDLETRTRAIIEAIRFRLVQKLAASGAPGGAHPAPLRATSPELTQAAALRGYTIDVAPQIGSV